MLDTGHFVSHAGYSNQYFGAFTARRIILIDGMDVYLALRRRTDPGRITEEKARSTGERKQPFVHVSELFP
jgi:hypothetical protein